jgi:hypothetical protein
MSSKLTPIRLSHLLSHSGVGAIVRGPDWLGVVQDIRNWTERYGGVAGLEIPYVERVRSALEISQQLREPPVASELKNGLVDGVCVPVTRFPTWARCPACGALYRWPWQHKNPDEPPRCTNEECAQKKGKTHPMLEQVTWALVDPRGYLADVPWHFLTHRKARHPEQKACKVQNQLYLKDVHGTRTLGCRACRAEITFRGDEWIDFGQGRVQPWTKDDLVPPEEKSQKEESNQTQILAVNDTRTYSPVTDIALVIPPESRVRKGTVVDQLYRNSRDRERIDKARTPLARNSIVRELATKYHCLPPDIIEALEEIKKGYPNYGASFTPGLLLESEFDAFSDILEDQQDDEDLVTHDQSEGLIAYQMSGGIARLVRVDRLKAIKVFRGFRRLNGQFVPADIVGTSDWLPAVPLYGEGIFVALEENRLRKWENHPTVQSRLHTILPRFEQSGRKTPDQPTARFMLLHTLSHLLIRQIESEAGYPAASLTERIYCAQAPKPMAGILIYVAVPDIAGSLGGLAELAEPRRFSGILKRTLEHAQWCSLDPVCSEHQGQGPGLLNRAACHACALVPEPACEHGNILLDRVFVKGDTTTNLPSFFE